MDAIDKFFGPHAAALSIRQQRMEVIGANIANAATPNYKARDIDFAAAYQQANAAGASLATTNPAHLPRALGGSPGLSYRTPVSRSLDGNTVELHVEQLQFAENATRYEASLQFLGERIRGLRSALRGE